MINMTRLERRLQDALLEAKRRLARGDINGAGLELDAAAAACSAAVGQGIQLENPDALLDLVRACTVAARRDG